MGSLHHWNKDFGVCCPVCLGCFNLLALEQFVFCVVTSWTGLTFSFCPILPLFSLSFTCLVANQLQITSLRCEFANNCRRSQSAKKNHSSRHTVCCFLLKILNVPEYNMASEVHKSLQFDGFIMEFVRRLCCFVCLFFSFS